MGCLRALRRWIMEWAGYCHSCGLPVDGVTNVSGCLCNDRGDPCKLCDGCGLPLGDAHYSAVPGHGDLCLECHREQFDFSGIDRAEAELPDIPESRALTLDEIEAMAQRVKKEG